MHRLFEMRLFCVWVVTLMILGHRRVSPQIQKVTLDAEEACQGQLSLVNNSDPEAMSGTKLVRAALEFLRKRGIAAGQFFKVAKDADLAIKESRELIKLQADGCDYADSVIPEFECIVDKHNTGHPLNAQEKVIH